MMTGNKHLENMAKLKYLGMTLANKNCMYIEQKTRLNSE